MSEPLFTPEEIKEIATDPASATDEAGTTVAHPLKDVIAAAEFLEKRGTGSKNKFGKVHSILSKGRARFRPGGTTPGGCS